MTTERSDVVGSRSELVERLRARVWPEDAVERRFNIGVWSAMALGLAIRVAFVLIKQAQLTLTTGDAFWYHMQARLVADGKGFLNPFLYQNDLVEAPGADHPPGFVIILAVLDLIGISTPQGQRLVMCLVGTVSIGLIALLARRLGGRTAGVVAAFIAAVYPNIWINDGMLMVETVYMCATVVSLLLIYRYLREPSWAAIVWLSVAILVGAMTRPESLVIYLVLVPLVLSRTGVDLRRRIAQLAVAALIPIAAFAPWVAYNYGRFEEPVLISTGAGQTLAAGNCELTYDGPVVGYYSMSCLQEPLIDVPTGDASQRDPEYRRIALEYMWENKSDLPKVMVARVARLWHLYAPIQSLDLDGWVEGRQGGMPSGDKRIVGAALISYYVLLPFAVAGGVLLVRRRRTIWPMLIQPILATLVAAGTFGITRYRVGAEITLVIFASVAMVSLARVVRSRLRTGSGGTESTEPARGWHGPPPADEDGTPTTTVHATEPESDPT